MVKASFDRSAHGSQLSEGRREGESEEASTRVHCQRQLGKHRQERRWTEPRQEVQNRRVYAPRGVPISGEHFAEVVAEPLVSRRSLDEDDGEGHSCPVLQQSLVPVCSHEGLREQKRHRKWMRIVLPRNEFESLPSESNGTDSRVFVFFWWTAPDSQYCQLFCVVLHGNLNSSRQPPLSV